MSVNSKGIDSWNVLPKTIKDSVSIEVFKKRVRYKDEAMDYLMDPRYATAGLFVTMVNTHTTQVIVSYVTYVIA